MIKRTRLPPAPKLALREQSRWGLSGQWHRDEDCVAARARLGAPNGASEATNRATRPGGALDAYANLAAAFDGRCHP